MQTNTKQIIGGIGMGIILGFLVYFFYSTPDVPVTLGTVPVQPVQHIVAEEPEAVDVGLPLRLRIPIIQVDAVVDYLGLTPEGLMDVPEGPVTVGWYKHGPRPGEKGNAVIDGHFGWKNNLPAVFDNLHKLHIGDKIYVEDNAGVINTFVVRELRRFDPEADATEVFISTDGKSHLNLITCEGIWNAASKTFSKRLVVFAQKE